MNIGEVSRMLNVSTSTLRNWEQQGKIPQAQRRPCGMRIYRMEDIESIRQFLKTKQN